MEVTFGLVILTVPMSRELQVLLLLKRILIFRLMENGLPLHRIEQDLMLYMLYL